MELVCLLLRQLHALLGENGRPGPRPDAARLPMLLISLLVDSSIPEENTRTADCRAARCAVARETSGLSASCHRSTEAATHRPALTAITGGEIGDLSTKEEAGSLGPGLSTSIVHDEVLRGLMFLL